MTAILALLNMFSGPISALVEKTILSAVVYLFAAGKISGDATAVAAAIYAAFSAIFSAVTTTQGAKMQSVNKSDNGALVVGAQAARRAGLTQVNEPQASTLGSG